MSATPLKIQVLVDDKGTVSIRKFGSEAEKAGLKGETSFRSAGKSLDDMNRHASMAAGHMIKLAAAAVSVAALYMAVRKLAGAFKEYVELAAVQENAEKKLEAVLRATGYAAGYNAEQLTHMASSMQSVTTVGDEVILNGMAILATFKNVRGEAFERTTMAALDMSKALDQDLKSSMIMIGKAMNDPVKGMTAMSRAGVQFTDAQKDMAKQLVETGDIVGAQEIILKELEGQMGGVAVAARETFGGMSAAAGNALGDLKEEIGFIITKNEFFIEGLEILEEIFMDLAGEVKTNQQAFRDFAKNGILNMIDAMAIAVTGVGDLIAGFKSLSGYALTLQRVWLKLKELNIMIADPFGKDKIWQEMLLEIPQELLNVTLAEVGLAKSITSTKDAASNLTQQLIDLKTRLENVGTAAKEPGGIIPTLDEVTVSASTASEQVKALAAYLQNMEWLNSGQFEAAIIVGWEDAPKKVEKISKEIEKTVKDNAKEIEYVYQEMLANIQDYTADTFYDLFNGNIDGWDDMLDDMKSMFLRWLSEIAAAAVVKGIVVPLVFGSTSGSGSGGVLGTSTMGGSGGSLMDYVLSGLGLVNSGASAVYGESLVSMAYNYVASELFGTTAAYSASMASTASYGAVTSMGAGAGAGTGVSMTGIAASSYAAAIVAAIIGSLMVLDNQNNPDAAITAELKLAVSDTTDKLLTASMISIENFGFESNADIMGAAENIAAAVGGTVEMFNTLFSYLSDESQAAIRAAMEGVKFNFGVTQVASDSGIGNARINAIGNVGLQVGEYFTEYIAEALSAIRSSAVVSIMQDDIVDSSKLNLETYTEHFNDFYAAFNKMLAAIAESKFVFDQFEEFIAGEASLTELERAVSMAQIATQAYVTQMEALGQAMDEESISEWFNKEVVRIASSKDDLDALAASITLVDMAAIEAESKFQAYLDAMEAAGIDLEKLGDLTEEKAAVIEKAVSDLMNAMWDDIDSVTRGLSGMSNQMEDTMRSTVEAFQAIYTLMEATAGIVAGMDEYLAMQEKQLTIMKSQMGVGASGEQLRMDEISGRYGIDDVAGAQGMLDWFTTATLDDLKEMADSLGIEWENIIYDMAFLVDAFDLMGSSLEDLSVTWGKVYDEINGIDSDMQAIFARHNRDNMSMDEMQASVDKFNSMGEESFVAWAASLGLTDNEINQLIKDIGYLNNVLVDWQASIQSLTEDLQDRYNQATMSDSDYAQYQLDLWYEQTLAEIAALSAETGQTFDDLLDMAAEVYELEKEAAAAQIAAAEVQSAYLHNASVWDMEHQVEAEYEDVTDYQQQLRAIDDARQNTIDQFAELGEYLIGNIVTGAPTARQVELLRKIDVIRDRDIADLRQSILDAQQSIIDVWQDAADVIGDQINDIRLSSDNPDDALARLALLRNQISTTTGGDVESYLAGFETQDEKIDAMNRIREMWGEYLDLAQDAYQRPSNEYQAIYNETLSQLELMQGIAVDYQSQEEILMDQLSVLTDIRDLLSAVGAVAPELSTEVVSLPDEVVSLPDEVVFPTNYDAINGLFDWLDNFRVEGSYASGTDFVPKTGLYELHVGERVIPVNQRNYDQPQNNVKFELNINSTGNPKETAREVRKEMELFMTSGIGRKLIQTTARGQ